MRRIAVMLLAVLGTAVCSVGLASPASGSVPSACVWISLELNGSSTTIKKETAPTTCPTLPPPDPQDPCPGGTGHYNKTTVTSVPLVEAEVELLVCAKGL